ncbi:ABC transporter ATP-binding protein [uncultured Propionibacterium sp.]|uniref:ABC transporter ATP-binding protein n=1 Tax=uncultured Propionibacterium sp. TaxID=218066 RepID=UPI00292F1520|nr:ABC transporter ATP-binding protein [uncultured Propionibacterium sp.]
MTAPVLRAEHLAFSYAPGVPVLRDVSLRVDSGQVLLILGANGCGKSTLMRVLLGQVRHSAGSVELSGDEVSRLSPLEISRRVAMVFQEHHAPFPFSVMDVVLMGRAPHLRALGAPTRTDREICRQALADAGIPHLERGTYTELSGGERQMVLIARSLAQQAPLVMMDEPTSHLDYRNAATVLRTAHRLAAEQDKAVVMITHAPDQALLIDSTTALMKNGRFLACGPSEQVLTAGNLRAAYDMDIRVMTARDEDGTAYRVCRPVL